MFSSFSFGAQNATSMPFLPHAPFEKPSKTADLGHFLPHQMAPILDRDNCVDKIPTTGMRALRRSLPQSGGIQRPEFLLQWMFDRI